MLSTSPQAIMMIFVLASLLTASLAQQVVLDSIHNATSLTGTWSSGSRHVLTGPVGAMFFITLCFSELISTYQNFANPAKQTFNYPTTTGVSYSFTDDGFFEIARYRFIGNGTQPTCITGVIGWLHGRYTLNNNGSITMTPFGDGYQQIQDPCAAVSNFIEPYTITEHYTSWRIFTDPLDGYKLHLFQYDGAPLAPQFQVSTSPMMLPTQPLRNVTSPSLTAQNRMMHANEAGQRWRTSLVAAGAALWLGLMSMVI